MTPLNLHEKKLLDRLYKGDPKALEEIYQRYAQQLYAYALQLCQDSHTAQDLLQELMLKIWMGRKKLNLHTGLRPYLYKTIYRQFQDSNKQKYRQLLHLEQLRLEAHLEIDDTPAMQNTSQYQKLQKQIAKLPPRAQEILRLHKWEQLTHSEIAQYLNLSPRTVENHIRNAMRLLRKGFLEESKKDP